MPGADGYITYSTKLDNENLEKDLSSTTKKIERLEKQLQKNSDKRLPISRRVSELGAQLDKAKAKLVSLQDEAQRIAGAMSNANSNDPASIAAYTEAAARQASITRELAAQQKTVDGLQAKFDQAADRLDDVDTAAKRINGDLATAKDHAGKVAKELYKPATAADAVARGGAGRPADQEILRPGQGPCQASIYFYDDHSSAAVHEGLDGQGSAVQQ